MSSDHKSARSNLNHSITLRLTQSPFLTDHNKKHKYYTANNNLNLTELRLCTKEDYERVGLGDSFEEASNITNYNELCIDNW